MTAAAGKWRAGRHRRRRHVALLVETSNAYARGLLRGIVAYVREHRHWSIYLGEHARGSTPPAWLPKWRGDGLLVRIETPRIARAVAASGRPVVDLSAARLIPSAPWVETDDRAIARLAAEHLLERGFRHFAYCGDDRFNWSAWRRREFAHIIAQAGYDCAVYRPTPSGRTEPNLQQQEADIAKWVRRLPRPVGVMACYDLRGQQVLAACRAAEIAVPDEVAVIGVDNDELVCELADPPLSSVVPDTHRTGYQAAAILDRLMSGRAASSHGLLVEPLGVVTRMSTDVLAIEDRSVSQALRFIRQHACEGIRVEDVLKSVPLSRRVLESRFKRLLGRTPHQQILKTQLDRAKELLLETELPLTEVARRCGFRHAEYFSVCFKQHAELPPGQFRARGRI